MLSRCPIRYKLLLGVGLLFSIVTVLSFSGFRGVYSYRRLARSVSRRAAELPLGHDWTRAVANLQSTFGQVRSTRSFETKLDCPPVDLLRGEFPLQLLAVRESLRRYRVQLDHVDNGEAVDPLIGDERKEWETLREIEKTLDRIERTTHDENWVLDGVQIDSLGEELHVLNELADELPGHLHRRMLAVRDDARGQYHTLIALTWTTSILTVVMLALFVKLFYEWIFRPLRVLIRGSRRVAGGEFDHRIQLHSHDEMAELAGAMNAMTSRFQEIRDDLDEQVKQRTKEVVRSEQLASVGFLAAGVAHEINNPLASIAWSAESLESRLHDLIHGDCEDKPDSEIAVLRNYLRKIQDEAFRCKGITEKLLDFSRLGDVEKQDTDLRELTADVIEMVRHLGKHRNKRIRFHCDQGVVAAVNPQEIKQVVLNLITNAFDSIDCEGDVDVRLGRSGGSAELVVSDNGCGMSQEVLEHIFEPFYTRRRNGQGTGLGLSITYRIVSDHGGAIEASSEGLGRGSQFRVTLPLVGYHEKRQRQYQAA